MEATNPGERNGDAGGTLWVTGWPAAGRRAMRAARGLLLVLALTLGPTVVGPTVVGPSTVGPRIASAAQATAATTWTMYQGNPAHTGQSPYVGLATFPLELWRLHLAPLSSPGEKSTGMSVAPDGTVYVSTSGRLFAIDPTDASIKWTIDQYDHSRSVPAISPSGDLYWGFGDGFVSIAPDGQSDWIWTRLTGNFVFGSSPVIDADGNLYFSHDGVWSLTAAGDLRWFQPSGFFSHSSPALGPDGTIYASVYQNFLAMNPNGTIKWSLPVETSDHDPVVASDGAVYVGAVPEQELAPARMLALNPNGTLRWTFLLDAPTSAVPMAPALGLDGTLYFGSNSYYHPEPSESAFYAVRPDGSLRWKRFFPTDGILAAPAVVDAAGNLTFCMSLTVCYGLNADGDVLWQLRWPADALGPNGTSTVPLLIGDGRMLFLDGRDMLRLYVDATDVVFLPIVQHP